MVLVHARSQEDKFVADGFGIDRRDVMYNDFVIVGPVSDPAGIRHAQGQGCPGCHCRSRCAVRLAW